jgi:hypothetical protein
MNGNNQRDHQKNGAFGPGFNEMKGIGGPGGGVGGTMMPQVGEPEYFFVVQEPVHPIEVGVVDDEAKDQAEDQPYDGMIGEIMIYECVF